MINEPTNFPSCTTIDLCLVTDEERVGQCEVLPPLPQCTHGPIKMLYTYQQFEDHIPMGPETQSRKIWNRANFEGMKARLDEIDWNQEFDNLGVQDQYRKFLDIAVSLEERYVPVSSSGNKLNVPWSLNPPRVLVRSKASCWHDFKNSRSSKGRSHPDTLYAWSQFCAKNEELKIFAFNSQLNYEKSVASQLNSRPKLFHAYVRHRKVCRPSIGPVRLPSGEISDNPSVMAECFSASFSGVYSSHVPINAAPHQVCLAQLENFAITPNDVLGAIAKLDANSSVGPDGIQPRFLKSLAPNLCSPLANMFNTSLREGELPAKWLNSIVVPIYKKGVRCEPLNYRPVSLTSVVCKTLERIIVKYLNNHLITNSLLDQNQFGFRSGRSTSDQLLLTYNDVSLLTDIGMTVDLIFFDFSKAFDKVCHRILLDKLRCIGVPEEHLCWIEYFISFRVM